MKILNNPIAFVDIDGVLRSHQSSLWSARREQQVGLTLEESMDDLCPIAVSNLIYIGEHVPDLKIVVSSAWRIYKGENGIRELFSKYGIAIEGITPYFEGRPRGVEILDWLIRHNWTSKTRLVIIDDDDDMVELKKYLVRTDYLVGLTIGKAQEAIDMLTKGVHEQQV